ncbi:MAG: glutamate--tRNA ligase family protein, partial [Patescibacteria group bacterium]|nr:glutamate--tRNA ligase family protein [Patescibacteria group bacterium]
SKRDMTGLFGVRTWLSQGYLPEAIINYLMLLGWAPKDNREIFSLNDFIQAFDQDGVQKANPVFNSEKLDWFNGQYIRMLSEKELADKILDFYKDKYPKETVYYLSPLVKSRIRKLVEFEGLAGYVFKRRKPIRITDNFEAHIKSAIDALSEIYDWNKENIDNALLGKIKECGFKTGDFFMDLRGAIAGSRVTPPFNESLVPIGKLETLERLKESLL